MKNFNGLVLCNYRSDRVEVHVRASIEAGALTVEGQDLGAAVEQFWGIPIMSIGTLLTQRIPLNCYQ